MRRAVVAGLAAFALGRIRLWRASAASAAVAYRSCGLWASILSSTRTKFAGISGRYSVIGVCRPPIRLPSRSIGELAGKRQLAAHQVVHRTAQAIQIATAVDFAAARLLGRHVVDRPDRDAIGRRERRRAVGLHQHAQSKVEDLDPAIVGQAGYWMA